MTRNSKYQEAEQLAMRPYSLFVFLDQTTDDDTIYVAVNPELKGCVAQGETVNEAEENLAEVRIDYITHLLAHGLTIPEPNILGLAPAPKPLDAPVDIKIVELETKGKKSSDLNLEAAVFALV